MHDRKICFLLSAIILAGCAKTPDLGRTSADGSSQDNPETFPAKIIRLGDDILPDSFIVKMESGAECEDVLQVLQRVGATCVRKVFPSVKGNEDLERRFGMDRWFEVFIEDGVNVENAVRAAAELPEVATVQFNVGMENASDGTVYPYEEDMPLPDGDAIFNDPLLGDQWHYINTGSNSGVDSAYPGGDINVAGVWRELTCGDPSIIVAVVDEGIKYNHPDLEANMWKNPGEIPDNGIDDDGNGYVDDVYGYNFVDNGAVTWAIENGRHKDEGHGTHCAGTIAAVNNNGLGVSGVAGGSGRGDGCRIMSCQIFSARYGGSSALIAEAIKYAADNGASIISCSFSYTGGKFTSDREYLDNGEKAVENAAIQYFKAKKNNDVLDGGIAIFAAGNDKKPYSSYPAALHDIISVVAFAPDYLPALYTNYGPGCNIAAPGGEDYLAPYDLPDGNYNYRAYVLSTFPSELFGTGASRRGRGYDYGYLAGTSMATPHVSGVAALGISYARKLGKTFTVQEFKNLLLTSVNSMDSRLETMKKDYDKNHNITLDLTKFINNFGTGSIDAWKLMMNIEGTPCLEAVTGEDQGFSLADYFGGRSGSLTYLGVSVSDEGRESLGLAQDPEVRNGCLYVYPTKPGAAKFVVRAIAGGNTLGGLDQIGGMEIYREISVIARAFKADNGGWL